MGAFPKMSGTLRVARDWMLARLVPGCDCPCCGRKMKLYTRKINAEMARFLIHLVQAYQDEQQWYSTRDLQPRAIKATTDGVLFVHWGLIEARPGKNSGGARAGSYRPTRKGFDFVYGRIRVRSSLMTVTNKPYGFTGKKVNIQQCLKAKFDYNELMGGYELPDFDDTENDWW